MNISDQLLQQNIELTNRHMQAVNSNIRLMRALADCVATLNAMQDKKFYTTKDFLKYDRNY